jgi:tetrahydromethanopterin S-methyltransferase subunit F
MTTLIGQIAAKHNTSKMVNNSNNTNENATATGLELINKIDAIAREITSIRSQPQTAARDAKLNTLAIERQNLMFAASKDNSLWSD